MNSELATMTDTELVTARRTAREQAEAEQAAQRAAARDTAIAAHPAIEKAEQKRIDALDTDLSARRERLDHASTAMLAAATELWDAATDYNEGVRAGAGGLLDAGLAASYDDVGGVVHFQTGGAPKGRSLQLRGASWSQVEPLTVLLRALYGGLRARIGDHAPIVRELYLSRGVRDLERRGFFETPLPAPSVRPATKPWLSDEQREAMKVSQ